MNYEDFYGYSPVAPVLAPRNGQMPNNSGPVSGDVSLSLSDQQLHASGDFAVTGWLVLIIIGLGVYYAVYELSE